MKNKNKLNIIKIYLVLILSTLILLPTIVPFLHLLEDHEQNTCIVKITHIHEKEIDCSICDFHLNKNYYSHISTIDLESTNYVEKQKSELYSFTYYHQQLSFSLRGPPELL